MKPKAIIPIVLVLAGCGSSAQHGGASNQAPADNPPAPTSNEPLQSMAVADTSQLPTCDAAHSQELVYVKSSKQFQTCDGSAWSAIDVTGPAGPKGDAGAAGAAGVGEKISASFLCQANLSQATGAASGLNGMPSSGLDFYYAADITTAGDVFATARISYPAGQVSSTQVYAASQNGAAVAGVLLTLDATTTVDEGFWAVQVDRTTLIPSATYTDADITGGKATFTFPASSCTQHSY